MTMMSALYGRKHTLRNKASSKPLELCCCIGAWVLLAGVKG